MGRFLLMLLGAATLLVAGCGSGRGGEAEPAATSTVPATTPAPSEYVETFELVWSTINDEFYDPDFGGVDWEAAHDRYLPLITTADSGETVVELINAMLFELGVSHLFFLPPGEEQNVDPILTAEGWLGIDVRLLDGQAVVTSVAPGSPAAEAGLRPGDTLERILDQSIDQITASATDQPPRHERGQRSTQTNAVRNHLFGDPGDVTTIGYQDADGMSHEVMLTHQRRESASAILPGLPPAYTELEVHRLEGDIGYIRFNAFLPGLAAPISDGIDDMSDAPGLIFDLRGNHGGVFDVRKALVDKLVSEPVLLWTFEGRRGTDEIYVEPAPSTYRGPIVVLVDVLSASSAEEFAGGLQAIGRAVIVGEHTAGRDLIVEVAELPNGALLFYPSAQTFMADRTVLESRGVIPDIAVDVQRTDLLAGADAPLQVAIDHLRSNL